MRPNYKSTKLDFAYFGFSLEEQPCEAKSCHVLDIHFGGAGQSETAVIHAISRSSSSLMPLGASDCQHHCDSGWREYLPMARRRCSTV
jgi:hypothetical protein